MTHNSYLWLPDWHWKTKLCQNLLVSQYFMNCGISVVFQLTRKKSPLLTRKKRLDTEKTIWLFFTCQFRFFRVNSFFPCQFHFFRVNFVFSVSIRFFRVNSVFSVSIPFFPCQFVFSVSILFFPCQFVFSVSIRFFRVNFVFSVSNIDTETRTPRKYR